jgi:pyrimidine deaminase RibD-like protein
VAIEKARHTEANLANCTLYSSLEPCSVRRSGLESCCDLIRRAGIRRVVFGMREPPVFVQGNGAGVLAELGVEVLELTGMEVAIREINAHLFATAGERSGDDDRSV